MSKPATPRKGNSQGRTTIRTKQDQPAPAVTPEAPSLVPTVAHAEITARAYQLFLARGGNHGDDQADWFRAEAELRRERGSERAEPPGND
jgi:hypothetical protein